MSNHWKRGCAVVSVILLAGCSAKEDTVAADSVGTVTQAITATLTATPNPCQFVPGTPGIYGYATSITANADAGTYGIWVRGGNAPYALMACFGGTTFTTSTGQWIVPGSDVTFSLRSMSSCTATPGTEVASLAVRGLANRIVANGPSTTPAGDNRYRVLLPSGQIGSTTLEWWADPRTSSEVWVSTRDTFTGAFGPYQRAFCSTSSNGTAPFSSIFGDHDYRFSLRRTDSTNCTAPAPGGPEVANATVRGVGSFITATPTRCSPVTGGTCSTVLDWATGALVSAPQIWEYDGTTYRMLACPPPAQMTRTLTDGKTYTYELHFPASCGASRTSSAVVASATASALSSAVVPSGTGLQLAGQPYTAAGANAYDLWMSGYASDPYTGADCSHYAPEIATITDAASHGVTVLRVPVSRYGAADMDLWFSNRAAYLQKLDCMVGAARHAGVKLVGSFLWTPCTFVDRYSEGMRAMIDVTSFDMARSDLYDFAQTVAARYATDTGILGWELGNELNLAADIEYYAGAPGPVACSPPHQSGSWDHFTTDQLAAFLSSFASVIRSADPNHFITSGHANPRSSAAHLAAWPSWTSNVPSTLCSRPNMWCPDDDDMLASNMQAVTPEPIDVASVHFYNGNHVDNQVLGVVGPFNPDALIRYKRASDLAGKPLFVGEYMDDFDNYPADPRRNFARGVLGRLLDQHIPLSAAWLWESWWSPADIRPNANPLSDAFISMISGVTAQGNVTSRTVDATPPNSGFVSSTGGLPTSWTVTGTSGYSATLVPETFNGQAVRLSVPAGGQLRIESSLVVLGLMAPSSATLFAHVAALTDSTIPDAELCVYGYTTQDGSGTPRIACTALTGNPGQFLLSFASVAAPAVKSVRVRLVANGGGYAKFDDVGASLIY